MPDDNRSKNLQFSHPTTIDGNSLYNLAKSSKPLDLNSPYHYTLFATHFATTSLVARLDDQIVAFATGYFVPNQQSVLFVWQVATDKAFRGKGVALKLLTQLAKRVKPSKIIATISPSNKASFNLFVSLNNALNGNYLYTDRFFSSDQLLGNEEEGLFEITLKKGEIDGDYPKS